MNHKSIEFACPICKTRLDKSGCQKCNTSFQEEGVQSFICREMYTSEESYRHAMDIIKPAAQITDLLLGKLDGGVAIQADSRFIPLESESVDLVYSSGVSYHSSDIAKSISEIQRVLKPGGVACIMLYASWSINFLQQNSIGGILSLFGKSWKGEKAWETEGRKNPFTNTYTIADCKKLFSAFENVDVSKRGGRVSDIAKIVIYLPTSLNRFVDVPLGSNLNIVATKAR